MRKIDELYSKAVAAYEKGETESAKSWINKCLKLDQKEFRALNLLGVILANEGKNDAAANAYQRSLEANPRNVQTINNLANIILKSGDAAKAANLYRNAVVLNPNFLAARQNLAKAAIKLENFDEAIEEALKCFELDQSDGEALVTLGSAYKHKKEFKAAKEAFDAALNYQQSKKDALIELGVLTMEQKLYDEAMGYFVQTLQIDPRHAGTYCNIANVMIDKGEHVSAKGALTKALELNPNDATAFVNLGVLLKAEGKYEEAKQAFLRALELGDPKKNAAKVNLALICLAEGDYEQGLALYEYREKTDLICPAPLYRGEELAGKTILVYHEQGFGDTLNFARLLKHPKFDGANIIFSPQEPLQKLFKASSLGVKVMNHEEIIAQNPHFDYHISLVGLLYLLKTRFDDLPKNIPYIAQNAEKTAFFQEKLSSKKPKIGIVWRGNKEHSNDIRRSLKASDMFGLKNDEYEFVSLQKEFDADEMQSLKGEIGLIDTSSLLEDFSDTSALIDALDAVVTVDTSVAHLSGVKNKPTFLILHNVPDWRWGMDGEKSGWYDSVTLVRKSANEEWSDVIARIKERLKEFYI